MSHSRTQEGAQPNIWPVSAVSRDWLYPLVVLLGYFALQTLGIYTGMQYEEARDANAFLMAADGLLPYRDFDWLYGPLSFFIYPKLLNIFGVSLHTLRFAYMFFVGLILPVSYRLLRRALPEFYSAIGALLSVVFLQIPFYTYNHVFVVLFSLCAILCSIRFVEFGKKIDLWGAGTSLALVFLTKPLLPGVMLTAVLLTFWLTRAELPLRTRVFNFGYTFGCSLPVLFGFAFFFASQTVWAGKVIQYPPFFAKNSITQNEQVHRLDPGFLVGIIISRIQAAFFLIGDGLRTRVVNHYNAMVLLLLPLFPMVYVFFLRSRVAYRLRTLLDALAILGFFYSIETIPIAHGMNRAFTSQGALLLLFCYGYLRFKDSRKLITITMGLFFYLAGVPLFYFPIGKALKFRAPLSLPRANGLKIETKEKVFYEDLRKYFIENSELNERIGVVGYYPTIPFLTERRNIFEDEEYLFLNLHILRERKVSTTAFENHLLQKIERHNPRYLISFHRDPFYEDFTAYMPRYRELMETKYSPLQSYTNIDLYGLGQAGVSIVIHERKP